MINVPQVGGIVSRDQLTAIAKVDAKLATQSSQSSFSAAAGFDVEAWIQRCNVSISKRKPYSDGGTLWEISRCPWKPESNDGGPFIIKFASGHVTAGCHHNNCQNRTWLDFRDHYEPGWRLTPVATPAPAGSVKESPSDPHRLAKLFIQNHASHPTLGVTLRWWAGEWYRWNGSIYVPRSADEIKAELVACVKAEFDRIAESKSLHTGDSEAAQSVSTSIINNVVLALQSLSRISADVRPPAWLASGLSPWPAHEIIAAKNGLIHLPSFLDGLDFQIPATPAFFTLASLDYDVARDAGEPERWLQFLSDLWPTDQQSIYTLQMWFGLCLTSDTRQQKILGLFGPKRSGKGTIARVLTALVGKSNVVSPTATSLTAQFGLQGLIGKTLAIIPDARISNRTDSSILVERLLSISGEDALLIDRKHRDPINVKLTVRLMIVSNELPRLADASGAFASRLIILRLTRSFFGEENFLLADDLLAELPAIFRWAVEGWRKLLSVGRLVEPESSAMIRRDLEDIASPVAQFIRECCETGPLLEIARAELYRAYAKWCELTGIRYPESPATFGKSLRAVLPGLDDSQPRTADGRERCYVGIDVTSEARRRLSVV